VDHITVLLDLPMDNLCHTQDLDLTMGLRDQGDLLLIMGHLIPDPRLMGTVIEAHLVHQVTDLQGLPHIMVLLVVQGALQNHKEFKECSMKMQP
jgi:hypothetical protein